MSISLGTAALLASVALLLVIVLWGVGLAW